MVSDMGIFKPMSLAHTPIVLPLLLTFLACFGSTIIHDALPSIPFLLPTAVLLFPLTSRAVPWQIRGLIKTTLAFFFIFSAVQNIFSFQLNNSFIGLNYELNEIAPTNPGSTFQPLDTLIVPRFITITDNANICTQVSETVAVNHRTLSYEDSTAKCIELVPILTIPPLFTIGETVVGDLTIGFTRAFRFDAVNTLTNQQQVPPSPASLLQSLQLQRAKTLLTTRSLIPAPEPSLTGLSTLSALIFKHITTLQYFIFFGLIFSMVGDVCLIFGSIEIFFLLGLAAFLLGHVNFAIAFYTLFNSRLDALKISAKDPTSTPLEAIPIQIVIGVIAFAIISGRLFVWMRGAGKLKGPMPVAVLMYLIVISTMCCLSLLLAFALPPTTPHSTFNYNEGMEYRPVIHKALIHVVDVIVRAPMYISTLIAYKLNLTTQHPFTIIQNTEINYRNVSPESWQVFFGALGSVLFVVSDIFVAREKFVKSSPTNTVVGLPLYFVAQLLIANNIFF